MRILREREPLYLTPRWSLEGGVRTLALDAPACPETNPQPSLYRVMGVAEVTPG
jgi:hypothetical protein